MKYLTFDIEIARDLNKIPIAEFKPEEGEKVKILQILQEPIGNEVNDYWENAIYKDGCFVLGSGETYQNPLKYWHPIDNTDWKRFSPLGITCAAAASSDGGLWNWWAHDGRGQFTPDMNSEQCFHMVSYLAGLVDDGYTIFTWNGLGFDFSVLAEESGCTETCRRLALGHIDMMFHFFCSRGYPLGLDTASKGMGLPGKPEGMDGAKAPELWPTDPHKVMAYCSLDAENTLAVAEAVDAAGHLNWTARSGRPNSWACKKWLTVKEAMALPEPDTSWMDDPWERSKFYGWTGYEPTVPSQLFDPTGVAQWDPDEGSWPSGSDETKPDDDYDQIEEEEWREIQGE